ncbi:MAG TPA: DUF481 domain-containing protein [Gemmatimonadales bacterium]|nr:DUF481 domain-containing protein [Gemmatimonadales bacterium]
MASLAAQPLSAQKVDTVVIRNGDRIVGEIKALDHGALTYKTDDVGTLTIKWDKIDRIVSPRYFEVEDQSGRRYYGNLQPSREDGRMVVAVSSFIDTLDIVSVVRIYPIGRSFLARVDGHLNLAASFQRANKLRDISVDFEAEHRTQVRLTKLQSNVYFQAQEGANATSRNSVALSQLRMLKHRWLLTAAGQLQQNEELDLAVRGLLGAGGGRFLSQTNRLEILVLSGLAYTNERFYGSSASSNLELLVTGQADYYRRDSPKTTLESTLTFYPSITDLGRIRSELDVGGSHEVIKDFNIGLTVFDNFDSRPPSTTASKNDFGLTFFVGWIF